MPGPAPFLPVTPLIATHVAAGIGAVVAGAVAIFATKGSTRHRRAGLCYLAALTVLASTGGMLALEAWAARAHLFVLGTLAFILALVGYAAKRRRRDGWMARHLVAMGTSYVVMLTAFYVDNGPRLPLWWRLPTWALWVLPSAIGAPLIGRALVRRRRLGMDAR
jgi:uncharacterized membrane protein